MYKTVLFDLDGTLTDPGVGITKSVAYALAAYGIRVEDLSQLTPFIGPPLAESFSVYYGFSPEQAAEAVEKYREYFRPTGIFENTVYPGVPELLSALRAAGHTLALATSKPTVFARQILEHFDLARYFSYTLGSELDGRRVKKAEVVAEVLRSLGADPASTVMVGDREHDVLGAAANGIPAIGVLYGYGSREELQKAGASAIAETPADLQALITEK